MKRESWTKTEPERRPEVRQRVLLRGLIVYGTGAFTCDCTFRNLSASGARIKVPQLLEFPSRFHVINIRDGVAYDSRVIWNKGLEIGIKFEAGMSLVEDTSHLKRQLKRLWLAKAPH